MTEPEPITPCAACEHGKASFILESGAPVCGDCYMNLGHPEAVELTESVSHSIEVPR